MKVKQLKFQIMGGGVVFFLRLRDFVNIYQGEPCYYASITYLHAGKKEKIIIDLDVKQNNLNAQYLFSIQRQNQIN